MITRLPSFGYRPSCSARFSIATSSRKNLILRRRRARGWTWSQPRPAPMGKVRAAARTSAMPRGGCRRPGIRPRFNPRLVRLVDGPLAGPVLGLGLDDLLLHQGTLLKPPEVLLIVRYELVAVCFTGVDGVAVGVQIVDATGSLPIRSSA